MRNERTITHTLPIEQLLAAAQDARTAQMMGYSVDDIKADAANLVEGWIDDLLELDRSIPPRVESA